MRKCLHVRLIFLSEQTVECRDGRDVSFQSQNNKSRNAAKEKERSQSSTIVVKLANFLLGTGPDRIICTTLVAMQRRLRSTERRLAQLAGPLAQAAQQLSHGNFVVSLQHRIILSRFALFMSRANLQRGLVHNFGRVGQVGHVKPRQAREARRARAGLHVAQTRLLAAALQHRGPPAVIAAVASQP